MSAREASDAANVVAPPPFIYLAGLAAGFVLEALLPSASVPTALSLAAGLPLVIVGTVLGRSFFRALGRARTTVSPYSASTALVTTGPYRLSRNPGYLGMALAYAGIAFLSGALWLLATLVVVLAVVDRGVILREERYLERAFGERYIEYKRTTRRWI